MKDFLSYTEENDGSKDFLKEAQSIAEQYAGKGDAEIANAIFARAVEGKRNGTLTNEQIDEFCERFSALLDGAKRRRLKKLAEELKKM